jgi:hypothetical protein
VPILGLALHDEEVEIAVRTSVTARTLAEEHDLDRIGSKSGQGLACRLDDLLRNHDDTKRYGVKTAEALVPPHPTLGDVDSPQALIDYQAAKKAHKKEWSKHRDGRT